MKKIVDYLDRLNGREPIDTESLEGRLFSRIERLIQEARHDEKYPPRQP
jgi:hypothetical protein